MFPRKIFAWRFTRHKQRNTVCYNPAWNCRLISRWISWCSSCSEDKKYLWLQCIVAAITNNLISGCIASVPLWCFSVMSKIMQVMKRSGLKLNCWATVSKATNQTAIKSPKSELSPGKVSGAWFYSDNFENIKNYYFLICLSFVYGNVPYAHCIKIIVKFCLVYILRYALLFTLMSRSH